MNRVRLLSSWFYVTIFWYLIVSIVYVVHGGTIYLVLWGILDWVRVIGIGLLGGIAWSIWLYFYRSTAGIRLDGGASDGIARVTIKDADDKGTLYSAPMPVIDGPARVKYWFRKPRPPFYNEVWFKRMRARHPEYAMAMIGIYGVMANKNVPASLNGAHGGLSLVDHSVNVIEAAIENVSSWQFDGIKSLRGSIIRPSQGDSHYRFDEDDPLPKLAAFAHDIGKTVCYKEKAGAWIEDKKRHAEIGAAMLRLMPEIDGLEIADRDALLLSVEFYHSLSEMPLADWIGERAYALAVFLYDSDRRASDLEGGVEPKKIPKNVLTRHEPERVSGDAKSITESITESIDPQDATPEKLDEIVCRKEKPVAWISETGLTAMDVLSQVLATPNAINGKNKAARVAFKHGPWVYVIERSLRLKIEAMLADKSLQERPFTDVHPYTTSLLLELGEHGLLRTDFCDHRHPPIDCLFTADYTTTGTGDPVLTFCVSTSINYGTASIADATYKPKIIAEAAGRGGPIPKDATTDESKAPEKTSMYESIDVDKLPELIDTPPKPKQKLTSETLRAMVLSGEKPYNMQEKKVKGLRYCFVEIERLQDDFSLDEDEIAQVADNSGIALFIGKSSGKRYFQVPVS